MPKIIPIKDLKNTSDISEMCHRTDEPIYITKNGYGDMVIMSMESYESQMKRIKMYEDIEASEEEIKEGKVKDARKSLSSMRERYGLYRLKNTQAAVHLFDSIDRIYDRLEENPFQFPESRDGVCGAEDIGRRS